MASWESLYHVGGAKLSLNLRSPPRPLANRKTLGLSTKELVIALIIFSTGEFAERLIE